MQPYSAYRSYLRDGPLSLVPELAPVHAHSRMPYEQLLATAHDYFRVAART